ncbi:MAG TPA: glycosyltransferase family 39 protein [Candidatus Acidoferrales bacterium]|jgi:hypothetical protein|nr:glycosyltransferase family 39 protein [Candidatus Acidoferrales bacterium]
MSAQSESSSASLSVEKPNFPASIDKADSKKATLQYSEEDLARALFILFIPVVLIETFFRAASRALWFDEILTHLIADQPNVEGMWTRLSQGVTSHPPTFYLIEHVVAGLGGSDRIVFRLVSIAAYFCVVTCLFIFVRRRTGGMIAFLSVLALHLTLLYDFYAFEARPYEVMVACIALALLCYERVDSWAGAILFAVCLATASSLNFYAGFAFFPFGLAELFRSATERKVRPQVWAGFLVGLLPYIFFWPLLHIQQVLFSAHSFAAPTFWAFATSIGELMRLDAIFSCGVFAGVLIYLIYLVFSGEFKIRRTGLSGSGFSLCDVVLTIGFLALPIVTYIVAKIANGVMTGRYVITASLGISLALSLLLSRLGKPALLSVGLAIFCVFTFKEGMFVKDLIKPQGTHDFLQGPAQMSKNMNIPLVISNAFVFLPAWYSSNDSLKSQLFYLADSKEQFSAWGFDTPAVQILTLKYLPLMNIDTFPEFAHDHRKFLLYSTGNPQDFWPRWLLQRGYLPHTIDVDPPSINAGEDDGGGAAKAILYFVDLDERK